MEILLAILQVLFAALEILLGLVEMFFAKDIPRRIRMIIAAAVILCITTGLFLMSKGAIGNRIGYSDESLDALPHQAMSLIEYAPAPPITNEILPVQFHHEPENATKYQIDLKLFFHDPRFVSTGIKINLLQNSINFNETNLHFQVDLQNNRGERIKWSRLYDLMKKDIKLIIRDGADTPFDVTLDPICYYDMRGDFAVCNLTKEYIKNLNPIDINSIEFHVLKPPHAMLEEQDFLTIYDIRFERP